MLLMDAQPGMKFRLDESGDTYRVVCDGLDGKVIVERLSDKSRDAFWRDLWVEPLPRYPVWVNNTLHLLLLWAVSILCAALLRLAVQGHWFWVIWLPVGGVSGWLYAKHVVWRTVRF